MNQWDEYYITIAKTVATKSKCLKRHVGALLVIDGHVASTGYNGPPRGITHCTTCARANTPSAVSAPGVECPGCHAEINSIIFSRVPASGATLYITTAPCFDCAKYIINSGIKRVVIPTTAIRESVKDLLKDAGIDVVMEASTVPAQIQLTKDKIAIVDEDLHPMLSASKWCSYQQGTRWYATHRDPSTGHTIAMHRYIADYLGWDRSGKDVDHINHNGLDNRVSNLRVCTRSQNNMNRRGRPSNNSSGYIGVSWHGQTKKWRACLVIDRKQKHIGMFDNKDDAAIAYNKAALAQFGEYATLNDIHMFPDRSD